MEMPSPKSAPSLPRNPTTPPRTYANVVAKPRRFQQIVERTSRFRFLPKIPHDALYTTEEGTASQLHRIFAFDVVQKAEERLRRQELHKEYPPLDGDPAFNQATRRFLVDTDHRPIIEENRVATAQTYGGIGALRIMAAFVEKFFPNKTVFIPDPCPAIHKAVLSDAKVSWKEYAYFDSKTHTVFFERMMQDLMKMPKGSIVVLHGCAQDPTGVDPTRDQWNQIADLCIEKELLPLLDMSHQGLASGSLQQDADVVRLFAEKGLEICVIQSYSKNLGLRNHRIGGLNFLLSDKEVATRVQSQLAWIAAGLYAFPPIHGARIVTEILHDPTLLANWKQELEDLHSDVESHRESLSNHLIQYVPKRDWSYLSSQKGLDTHICLTSAQIGRLRQDYGLDIREDGKIPLVHLSSHDSEIIAKAMANVLLPSSP